MSYRHPSLAFVAISRSGIRAIKESWSPYVVDGRREHAAILRRTDVARRGRRLEYFTVAWNTLEGLMAVVAGAIAGSISLVGFGIDSFIEVTSGAALWWRPFFSLPSAAPISP